MIQFGRGSKESQHFWQSYEYKVESLYKKSRSRIHGFKDCTEKPNSRSLGRGILSSVKSVIILLRINKLSQSLNKQFCPGYLCANLIIIIYQHIQLLRRFPVSRSNCNRIYRRVFFPLAAGDFSQGFLKIW